MRLYRMEEVGQSASRAPPDLLGVCVPPAPLAEPPALAGIQNAGEGAGSLLGRQQRGVAAPGTLDDGRADGLYGAPVPVAHGFGFRGHATIPGTTSSNVARSASSALPRQHAQTPSTAAVR